MIQVTHLTRLEGDPGFRIAITGFFYLEIMFFHLSFPLNVFISGHLPLIKVTDALLP